MKISELTISIPESDYPEQTWRYEWFNEQSYECITSSIIVYE